MPSSFQQIFFPTTGELIMPNIGNIFGTNLLKGFHMGCEFEIESVKGHDSWDFILKHGCHLTDDPSLRNSGLEIITDPKDSLMNLIAAHKAVNTIPKLSHPRYTHRTSIHCHVNFSDMTDDKVKQFIFLYAVAEPLFFEFVNEDRQENIFCVRLSATNLYKNFYRSIEDLVGSWHKYTAFNIKPLESHGTIEFRHLEGTEDSVKFAKWISTIKQLYDLNKDKDFDFTDSKTFEIILNELKLLFNGTVYKDSHKAQMFDNFAEIYLALRQPKLGKILFNQEEPV
jgi:hypothetical protein